jgi:hypothetical protein
MEDEMDRTCSMLGEMRNVCKIFVRYPKRWRLWHRWEGSIKMNLIVDWIHVV